MRLPRVLCIALICMAAMPAHAAPKNVITVNGFAANPLPRAIDPGRAQCAWAIGLAIPPTGSGTAFMIGNRREVMTSLHVVDRDCRGNRNFTFSHGFDRGHARGLYAATIVVHGDYCGRTRRGHHNGGDWAIAVLDRDPAVVEAAEGETNGRPLQLRHSREWLRDNGRYFLLGYGMSFGGGMRPYRSAACGLGRLFSDGVVEHGCDASRRSSGAPIVSMDAVGNCTVVALHLGEIAVAQGRPPFRDDINANLGVLAAGFGPAVVAVARELERGHGAREIAADLASHPPGR